ncbi:co-chaperone DjlA [Providencia vermicola]|uniref:co-chaperone DjlA n=1 Tax=Providencia TaxID=586 RepID=UPI0012B50B68|nr:MULTISPECIES: co-chaperone DjlA [Providencia]MBG5919529.1 co-chaperone DjlA [Providencia stuartii]MTB40820.1 co-chaperone DjlA [Providencia sp. wls1949]MTC07359.1 co-chaperone DjlA [Providencia sp. wls1948]QIC17050.1 co-chaperone DjlA [Providencia vermicola]WBA57800.1 co-chaperone DjlA [Providencia sp. 21OH12SH02B-Prov]
MHYWGKIIGVVLAIVSGLGFWGALVGLILGHGFDKASAQRKFSGAMNKRDRQIIFFASTFQILGHLTKAKGRVTETDIQLASNLMDRMQIHGETRKAAQQAFREGKSPDFPLRDVLKQLRMACYGRFDLIQMFLEIQLQAAFADGNLHPNERKVLFIIAEELGISKTQFEQFLDMIQGGRQFGHGYSHQSGGHYQPSNGPTIEDACKVLGVSINDDPTTIKRAYRKLMSEHHPDKLIAKGLPPEMMEIAKQKTQSIQAAYDLIKRERNFK